MPDYRLKLHRGTWYVVWSEDGGTRRVSLRTKDREDADRKLIDFKRDIAAPPGSLVRDYVQAYLDFKSTRIIDARRLEDAWRAAKGTFGHLRPDQITPELCEEYADMRREMGRADGTILKEINTLRQAMNWNKVTAARFEAPSAPDPRDRYLTREEYRALLAGCRQPHARLYIILSLITGGRRGAVLDLTWDRVDFERGIIDLKTVGGRRRKGRGTMPFNDDAADELKKAREAALTPYVIEYAGAKVANCKKAFAAAVKRAGLEDVTPHDLRHTAAVWMIEGGASLEEVGQFLGHSDLRVTYRVYARFSPKHLRKAAESLRFR